MELSAFVLIYPYKLYIFERGFKNLNILNIYENKENEINNIENNIYLLYNKAIKHYTLLKQNKEKNKVSNLEFIIYIVLKIKI